MKIDFNGIGNDKESDFIINTNILFKNDTLFDLLLNLFEYEDVMIRYDCMQILLCLMNNNKDEVDRRILKCDAGLQKIMDIMTDKREYVRANYLLILIELTSQNSEIQSFFAFQDGFSRLNNVIIEEEYDVRSVIICDCIHILYNVLHVNIVTQKLFIQSGFLSIFSSLLTTHFNSTCINYYY